MTKHWEYTEEVSMEDYIKYLEYNIPIKTNADILPNTAVYISCLGKKKLEGIYDEKCGGIRKLTDKSSPNKDLRLYCDAIMNEEVTIIAVDGLMGTGKTSTCVQKICEMYMEDVKLPTHPYKESYCSDSEKPIDHTKVLISKPHVNAGGSSEQYGFLPGDLTEKLDPTLQNFIQYFDRYHNAGFDNLRMHKYIEVLPLGFIRGLDAKDTILILDEAQNTRELISLVTRKASGSRIFILGDTSPFQIDLPGNTTDNNGLTKIIDLLRGAPYFQYIEMKSIEHVLRSAEVRDVVRRLYKAYGKNLENWNK